MSTETPAVAAETGVASLSDLLDNRHSATPDHEAHREVGEPREPDAAPPPSAQPAPTAETPPAAAPAPAAAATAEPNPASDPRAPKWYRDHMRKVNRELEQLRSERAPGAHIPAPRREAPPVQIPNPAEDPQGYHDAITRGFDSRLQQMQLVTTLGISERFAVQQHGREAFEECKAWLTTRPDLEAYFLQQPDPWGAAFSHYGRERLAEEIGDDPNAWRERERARIRDEILAEQGHQRQAAPAPAPTMRSAPPLAASTARSAPPERDERGRFAGPQPIRTKHSF